MIRLVITYSAGDGCTYSCDVALPIEYESAEAAIVDFETAARAAQAARVAYFTFAGLQFDASDFFWRNHDEPRYYSPEFLTVDEWFNQPR
jgi:hypothetical protein